MKYFLALSLLVCALTACIREELPNAEADILTCAIADEGILKREPIIENDKITIYVSPNADLARQAPTFTLTEGATISPVSGSVRDFSEPQTYIVTSEDGRWQKTYTVSFIAQGLLSRYSFENLIPETNNRFHIFAEVSDGKTVMEWASGNIGFALTGSGQSPEDYPTVQTPDGYRGKGARLTTRSTGGFGALMGMPIAAGNLFIGTFNPLSALSNPLQATQFGLPFYSNPLSFTGYYKYKAGDTYYRNGRVVSDGTKDQCNIYAVLYETDETLSSLDGTNILTHPNVISAAIIADQHETDEWTRFELPFAVREGKTIDPAKLEAGKYNLAVVFTSSIEGATFSGAVGSTLYIDEVEIISE